MITASTAKNEFVTISKAEYESLLEDSLWLECLNAAGVDNWSGIDYAHDLWREGARD